MNISPLHVYVHDVKKKPSSSWLSRFDETACLTHLFFERGFSFLHTTKTGKPEELVQKIGNSQR